MSGTRILVFRCPPAAPSSPGIARSIAPQRDAHGPPRQGEQPSRPGLGGPHERDRPRHRREARAGGVPPLEQKRPAQARPHRRMAHRCRVDASVAAIGATVLLRDPAVHRESPLQRGQHCSQGARRVTDRLESSVDRLRRPIMGQRRRRPVGASQLAAPRSFRARLRSPASSSRSQRVGREVRLRSDAARR